MNIIRTLLLAVLGLGALAFATPSQARDLERVYINGRTYYVERTHHRHYRDWERDRRGRVIIEQSTGYVDDNGVTIAFGGHYRHHRHHHHDWDRD